MTRTPDDLERYIREQGIDARVLRDVGDTPTVLDAARALGVPPDQIIKTLLFLVDGQPVLYITNGPAKVDRRVLARHFGVGRKKVKLADGNTVRRYTGYPPGGVPPFGHARRIPVFVDASVLELDVVYGGGGDERSMLRVSPREIVRVTQATVLEHPDTRRATDDHDTAQ